MKRVLIVSNLFPPSVIGGAEIVAHRQARGLAAQGFDVAVFAGGLPTEACPSGTLTLEAGDGFPVYRFGLTSMEVSENFRRPEVEQRFRSLLAAHRPELVHFHNLSGLGVSLIPAAKAFGARVVVTLHDHSGMCFRDVMLRKDGRVCTDVEECAVCLPAIQTPAGDTLPIRLRRDYVAWCLEQADLLLSPSAYLARAFAEAGVVKRPVHHLSNGTTTAAIPVSVKSDPDPVTFTCFGYVGEHKGIDTILDAAERLARDPELQGRWHLTIAGHGHLAGKLEQQIADGQFGDAVRFTGRLPHAAALEQLARTHVVVLASICPENEPVTLLEAIASGTAQIGARIGGIPELVAEGESGFLVRPGDPDELADAMRRFISEPDLAARFGAFNAQRRDRFDEARTLERLQAFYAMPADDYEPDDILVLCAGREPETASALQLQMMLHRFHVMEDRGRRIRFVWQDWADTRAWDQARLLWFWSEIGDADLPLVSRALRAGCPVLAPSASAMTQAAGSEEPVIGYETLVDAIGVIASLQDVEDDVRALGATGRRTSRFLTTLAPRTSFHLPLRALS